MVQRSRTRLYAISLGAIILFTGQAADISNSEVRAESSQPATHDSSKILSIGGDVTEILYALGIGTRIVAVDTTSQYPQTVLKEKKNVGYMRALSPEGVLSVSPSIIIASAGAGPAETVRALKSSSVPYVTIPDDSSADGIAEKIRIVADVTGTRKQASALTSKLKTDFAELARLRAGVKKPLDVLFVLSAAGGRMIVGGKETAADAILKLSGANNAASGLVGFKPITEEALISMDPDAIILMSGSRGGHGVDGLRDLPAIKISAAGRTGRIREMDGLYLLGFGTRTPMAARDVLMWLYPDAGAIQ